MKRAAIVLFLVASVCAPVRAAAPPNVVLIFADDLGYGDLGCYGSKNPTPNLDRMAREGVRFTDFYVAQAVCSASRAALMTGCYSNRVSIQGALFPGSEVGISDRELTMAEVFKSRGYATGIVGKWHLGDAPQFLPTRHGFDEYFGLPYSNDMRPTSLPSRYPPLPLLDGEKVVDRNPDQTKLTLLYTARAVNFIERHSEQPFFLYVPHSMPHVPLAVSKQFAGKTGIGPYADVIAEIDWSVGQILAALKRHGLDEKTLVIFTSDNGPWLSYGNHGGSAGPLREGKTTSFEGGVREPCIMRWPGTIAPGRVSGQVSATIDLLPTFAALIGASLPPDRIIDGKDISPLLRDDAAISPHEYYFYYWAKELQAIRSGRWKLHFAHNYWHIENPGRDGQPGPAVRKKIELSLFDLEADPAESTNVADQHPDIVTRLQERAVACREDLGDGLTGQVGRNVRPAATVDGPASAPSTQHVGSR